MHGPTAVAPPLPGKNLAWEPPGVPPILWTICTCQLIPTATASDLDDEKEEQLPQQTILALSPAPFHNSQVLDQGMEDPEMVK